MEKEFSPTLLKKCFGKQILPAVINLTDNISEKSQSDSYYNLIV